MIQANTNTNPQIVADAYGTKATILAQGVDSSLWCIEFEDEDVIWPVLKRFGWLSWVDDHGITWEAEAD